MKVGKVWGETAPILQTPLIELHSVKANAGGYCSKHKHATKHNGFYVISGQLTVKCWKDYGLVDSTSLGAGDFTTVPPGEWHCFECVKDCHFLELYYLEPLSEDIIRDGVGGA